ncbi:MAG: carboxypeptidase-like regulatory domain-containing protein [Bacteroidota bacterium]
MKKNLLGFWFFWAMLLHGPAFALALAWDDPGPNLPSDSATLRGQVVDRENNPLSGATLLVAGTTWGTSTDQRGRFMLRIPALVPLDLEVRYLGYRSQRRNLLAKPDEILPMRWQLEPAVLELGQGVVVEAERTQTPGVTKINPLVSRRLANPSGNFETILQAFGARSQQEFSSQYQVRGGNYDENLT